MIPTLCRDEALRVGGALALAMLKRPGWGWSLSHDGDAAFHASLTSPQHRDVGVVGQVFYGKAETPSEAIASALAASSITAATHAVRSFAIAGAAVIAAGALTACSPAAPPSPPPVERFEVVSRTWREGFANNPTTAALLSDRQTGCLYSLAEGKGATPVITPDGKHAGCREAAARADRDPA